MRPEFLKAAVAFYERLATERGSDEVTQFNTALASSRVALLNGRLSKGRKQELANRRAIALLEELTTASAGNRDVIRLLVETKLNCGFSLLATRPIEAEHTLREALVVLDKFFQSDPEDIEYIQIRARAVGLHGLALRDTGQLFEAASAFQQAIEMFASLHNAHPDDMWVYCGLACARRISACCSQCLPTYRKSTYGRQLKC